jgi:hypothetical protein
MNAKYFIYPYTQHSAGSIMLSEELDGKRVKLHDSIYTHKPENILINWGNGNCPYPMALNPASAINEVIDKIKFFKKLAGTSLVPPVAFSQAEAKANLSYPIVCRTLTDDSDGHGIVIADKDAQVVPAKLYTQYIDKTSEYRIHMGRNQLGQLVVICRQKKYLSEDFTGDKRIWTGGQCKFSYIETAVGPVIAVAKAAFEQFPELTFGAFDIVYNNSTEEAYVLEINSAPMMNTDTTKAYGDFFRTFTVSIPQPQENTTVEHVAHAPTSESSSSSLYPLSPSPLYGFVKTQLAAGHISKEEIEKYTPKPTEEQIIANYVNTLTAN